MLLQSLIEASVSFSPNHEERDVLPPRTRKSSRRDNGASYNGSVGNESEVSGPYPTRKSRRLHQICVNNDAGRVLSVVLDEKLNRGSVAQIGSGVPCLQVECPTELQRSSRQAIGLEPLAFSIRHESSRPYPIHSSRRIKKNSIVILSEEPTIDEAEKDCSEAFGGQVQEPKIEVSVPRVEKDCSKTRIGSGTGYGGKVLPDISEENLDRGGYDIDGSVQKSLNRDDVPYLQVECPSICTINHEQDFDSFSSLQSEDKVVLVHKSDNGFDVFSLDELDGDAPVKQICVSLLRSWGLVERSWPLSSDYISELSGTSSGRGEVQPCKICGQSENTMNMLLCDHCDEAFHLSCSNSKEKLLPTDEWFCSHCLGKKFKASTESYFLRSRGSITWGNAAAKSKFGPIAFILRYPEAHKSSVRIGNRFQAEVPEWSIQNSSESDGFGEPLEMNPADILSSLNGRLKKFSLAGSYSNWLQCREILHKESRGCAERSICGKWRRAPFNEVQTGNWDCSCAVVWDPIHSDCAVPQELDTEEVQVHLKYINKMRTRLAAKRR